MDNYFEDFKTILANNEIYDISEKYMLELFNFFEQFKSEIPLVVSWDRCARSERGHRSRPSISQFQ